MAPKELLCSDETSHYFKLKHTLVKIKFNQLLTMFRLRIPWKPETFSFLVFRVYEKWAPGSNGLNR